MKGKKKAREMWVAGTEDASVLLMLDGVWHYRSECAEHCRSRGYTVFRPIKVRIVPVLPKKRGARR